MKPILLDTGCIVALLDRSDRYHGQCRELAQELGAPLVTCEAVIAEACYLLRNIPGAADAVLANVDKETFRVAFALPAAAKAVRALLKKYASVPMDLADACLVQMADELGTESIMTLDSDFSVYRWRKRREFHNLIELA